MIDLVWFGFEFPIDPRFRFRSRFPFVWRENRGEDKRIALFDSFVFIYLFFMRKWMNRGLISAPVARIFLCRQMVVLL